MPPRLEQGATARLLRYAMPGRRTSLQAGAGCQAHPAGQRSCQGACRHSRAGHLARSLNAEPAAGDAQHQQAQGVARRHASSPRLASRGAGLQAVPQFAAGTAR